MPIPLSLPSLQVLSGRRLLYGWEALCGCDQDSSAYWPQDIGTHSFIHVFVPPSLSSSRSTRVSLCPLYPTTKTLQLAVRRCTHLWHRNIDFPTLRLRTPPGPISLGLCSGCFCSGVMVQMVSSMRLASLLSRPLPFHLSVEQNQNLGFLEKYCHC